MMHIQHPVPHWSDPGCIVGSSALGFRPHANCSLASGLSGRGRWLVFPQEAEHRASKMKCSHHELGLGVRVINGGRRYPRTPRR